jgi:DNA-nicking Smr family endonuclease
MANDHYLWDIFIKSIRPLCLGKGSYKPSTTQAPTFNKVLDLHGMTVQLAFLTVNDFIAEAKKNNTTTITIITGLSGEIRREFPVWLDFHKGIKSHQILNGGGAFQIKLK